METYIVNLWYQPSCARFVLRLVYRDFGNVSIRRIRAPFYETPTIKRRDLLTFGYIHIYPIERYVDRIEK